ncbi:hypothetical protein [Mycolicibacterium goodii]|uniref:PAS domain S-box/diguanylate cyclase (GGDEF) domain-containing protein n=1 Tax=Mycolicibacterium goodii TaxID=134601 RepID=A0A0K0X5Z6_MYCGD|nr:hypothetical protein AFA91_13995 [Mycolicibacterium goodii]
MSTDDSVSANDLGGADDMLSPMESTDSDDVLNDDGDEVVDPPEDWSGADKHGMTAEEEREGESLDDRLAAEEPDVTPDAPGAAGAPDAERAEGAGRHRGQVDGAPEDGESLYTVVEE